MNKPLALLFALVGTLLLAATGVSLSFENPWWIGFFAIAAVLFIGSGFVLKARSRKK